MTQFKPEINFPSSQINYGFMCKVSFKYSKCVINLVGYKVEISPLQHIGLLKGAVFEYINKY